MAYDDYCNKMRSLKYYIERENTGSADELADKLGVSRRTVFYYLDILRDEGYTIQYSRYRKTYYYENPSVSETITNK